MQRKGMELAIFWLAIIGPTLISLAGCIWYGGSKTVALWTSFCGIILLLLALTLQLQQKIWNSQTTEMAVNTIPEGNGGKGGNAKVNGDGIAIGGPGGPAGKYGAGGAGGSAVVHGDGLATGGAGGAAGDDSMWRAPAKSGYEIAQRKLGLPVDPYMRQFGRGGAVSGYGPKLSVVEKLRTSYFERHSKRHEPIFENINAVPLDYLNDQLAERNEIWRVRIVDDEYEFFVPSNK